MARTPRNNLPMPVRMGVYAVAPLVCSEKLYRYGAAGPVQHEIRWGEDPAAGTFDGRLIMRYRLYTCMYGWVYLAYVCDPANGHANTGT